MNISKYSYRILLVLILINLGVLFYLTHSNYFWTNKSVEEKHPKDIQNIVTVVLYDFEHFENDVKNSVKSITALYPKINILIVSNELPYPPLQLSSPQVKIKVLHVQPDEASKQGRPENFIKTEYTLFIPDGFLLKNGLQYMLGKLLDNNAELHMVAAGANGKFAEKPQCENLAFDMRRWTLKYLLSKNIARGGLQICDSIDGDVALILKTAYLQQLSAIFAKPHLEGLFIQSSLRNWEIGLIRSNSPFEKQQQMFASEHNRWKHEKNRKRQRNELYRRFGIKKVCYRDGSEEWFGCNKNTPRCFGTIVNDVPSFIYNGRWTPPCCLRNVRKTARHVFEIFDDNGIAYWLEGGSLLGAARSGDIIPWDYDVDIGMYKKDIEKLPQLKQARDGGKFQDADGFIWEKSNEGDFFRVQYSSVNHMHIDIFPFYEKNGIMTKDTWFKTHRQDTEFPERFLKPLERMKFIGMDVSVPNNYREFLEFKFGKGVIENPKYPNFKRVQEN